MSAPEFRKVRYKDLKPMGGSSPSVEFYRRNPAAFIRDEILEEPGEAWQLIDDRIRRRVVYGGTRRLPIIRTPKAITFAEVVSGPELRKLWETPPGLEAAHAQIAKDLKRIKDMVVESSRGPSSVGGAQQLKREGLMSLREDQNPGVSEYEVMVEAMVKLRADRDVLERNTAVHRVKEAKLQRALERVHDKLEKEEVDNELLAAIISRAYSALLTNHRTAKPKHAKPVDRSGAGGEEFCPTCQILVDMRTVVERREIESEVKT